MLNIRPMEKEDIQKISTAFLEQGWEGRQAVLESYWFDQQNEDRYVLIADLDGIIAGYVTIIKKAKHGPFQESNLPEVADFNVFEKYQKKGVGNALLDAAEEKAKHFSNAITLGVGLHHGYGAAQRIYVKRGYIPDGSGVWYKNDNIDMGVNCINNDDLVLYMSKMLK